MIRRRSRRLLLIALFGAFVTGCFALFDLDGYGTLPAAEDAGPDALDAAAKPDAVDAAPRPRIVFVTRERWSGDLGGLDGGDARCQAVAADAGLAGAWTAWLSDGERLDGGAGGTKVLLDGRPLRLPNGALVAAKATDLASRGPLAPIDVDQHGRPIEAGTGCDNGGVPVWTATLSDGGALENEDIDCGNWSRTFGAGVVGIVGGGDADWTVACTRPCAQAAALYCFER
ncbi:MAG: hypothetical protein KF819_36165 [Labilithrix sp.]|nr:hypothetical protein [Labilithrix sp.]